jgi:putative FmdB family regulatory protein
MPTYEYACTECGERLEVVQSFTDDPLTVCPVCQGRLRKLFSAVGVVFKGSGFYKTDSRPGKPKSPATADAGAGESGKSEGKSADPAKGSSPAAGADAASTSTPSESATTAASSDTSSASRAPARKPPAGSSGSTGGDSKVA